jgi:NAD(P)-dependent dehydrogenase (short-subunit alcohol dehydrogenase family)
MGLLGAPSDPDLFIDHTLKGKVKNKVVVITGGSSGIGKAAAIKIAEVGGKVVICGRDAEKLQETAAGDRSAAARFDLCRRHLPTCKTCGYLSRRC